jgi:hypothetical protein
MGRFRFHGRRPPVAAPEPVTTLTPAAYFEGLAAWERVYSSNLHSVAYYGMGASGMLAIRFRDKKTGGVKSEYRYHGVPYEVYDGLLGAGSKGKYFHSNIKGKYITEGPL